jgi:hypothetical protein
MGAPEIVAFLSALAADCGVVGWFFLGAALYKNLGWLSE